MTEPHAVRLNDLAAALNDVAVKYLDHAGSSAMYPAMFATIGNALLDLKEALTTPEQDTEPAQSPAYRVTLRGGGAGTTDGPGEPGSVTITPAPGDGPDAPYRSGEPLTRTTVTCTCERIDVTESPAVPLYMPGRRDPFCDVHGYRERTVAEIGLCGWRHPRWLDLYCTIRGDQYHLQHASHDRYGDLSWNPTLAAQGKLAEPAAKDWPAWTGNAL